MKKLLSLVLLASLAGNVSAQDQPYLVKTFEAVDFAKVNTSGGSITVQGGESNETKVEVFIVGNNNKNLSKEEIAERLSTMYELTVEVANKKLTAVAKSKVKIKDWKKALSISFKIYVPSNTSTELHTSGGSIALSKLSGGNQDFSTSGGSLNLDYVSGTIKGRTSGGSIRLAHSKENIDLATSGGSIDARDCAGKLQLNTSGGSIHLEKLDGELTAHTSGGSIDGKGISGSLSTHTSGGSIDLKDMSCSLDASTSGGHITVGITSLNKFIKIKNSGGSVSLDLPKGKGVDLSLVANRVKTEKMEAFNGQIEDDEIDGKLNGGGVPVTVRAGSGRISLGFK